jgi:hypothetical protein
MQTPSRNPPSPSATPPLYQGTLSRAPVSVSPEAAFALLRDFVSSGRPIAEDDTTFTFGDVRLLKGTLTSQISSATSARPYTLHTLVFLAQNRDIPYAAYLDACAAADVPHVLMLDRAKALAAMSESGAQTVSADKLMSPKPMFRSTGE